MTHTNSVPPCRLKFLFSRKGKQCVILRRGPTDWVRLILWEMEKNKFLPGQWLNGPIRDFDISPNGEYLIYFVCYHRKRAPYLWVAISKPPYFTALAMWPISDAWGGSCAFVDSNKIYIARGSGQDRLELSAKFQLKKFELLEDRQILMGENYSWDWKMKRNGWRPEIPDSHAKNHGMYFYIWKKKLVGTQYFLCLQNSSGNSKPNYWLEMEKGNIELNEVDCADIDPYERLIVARNGALHIATINSNKEIVLKKLADFNAQEPEEILAPNNAQRW